MEVCTTLPTGEEFCYSYGCDSRKDNKGRQYTANTLHCDGVVLQLELWRYVRLYLLERRPVILMAAVAES